MPIGIAGVELAASAAMHRDHADAAGFGDPRESRRVAMALVPAGAHLQGDRQVDRLDGGFENARGMQLVAHQRRAGMAAHDLFDRTAEIDVDQPRAAIGVELCRLGHDPRLAAGELHRHRLLVGAALRHCQRLPGLADRRLAGDHLGDDERGALPFDDPPERQIGDARHRRQDDRICQRDRTERNAHGLLRIQICLNFHQLF